MHPNYTPKKFLAQPINQAPPWGIMGGTANFNAWGFNIMDREAAWKTIMVPGRMKQRSDNWDRHDVRQNSKTATDSFRNYAPRDFRSWREYIDAKKALALALAIEEG